MTTFSQYVTLTLGKLSKRFSKEERSRRKHQRAFAFRQIIIQGALIVLEYRTTTFHQRMKWRGMCSRLDGSPVHLEDHFLFRTIDPYNESRYFHYKATRFRGQYGRRREANNIYHEYVFSSRKVQL